MSDIGMLTQIKINFRHLLPSKDQFKTCPPKETSIILETITKKKIILRHVHQAKYLP
jgi:hypothetical protein